MNDFSVLNIKKFKSFFQIHDIQFRNVCGDKFRIPVVVFNREPLVYKRISSSSRAYVGINKFVYHTWREVIHPIHQSVGTTLAQMRAEAKFYLDYAEYSRESCHRLILSSLFSANDRFGMNIMCALVSSVLLSLNSEGRTEDTCVKVRCK